MVWGRVLGLFVGEGVGDRVSFGRSWRIMGEVFSCIGKFLGD